ncbi:MAG: YgiT-type zinc finger protein [Planctomycetes bacterium]|nr:YgiT-type zinc finger protein [Planctomycetota bacterium]
MRSKRRARTKMAGDGFYGYRCEYCDAGHVRREIRGREIIRVTKTNYVILEDVPIGVCDHCHARYYTAAVIKHAERLHEKGTARKVQVPVGRYVAAG